MGTHNICLYKEVDKMYIGCNLKITELLDCAVHFNLIFADVERMNKKALFDPVRTLNVHLFTSFLLKVYLNSILNSVIYTKQPYMDGQLSPQLHCHLSGKKRHPSETSCP